MHPYRRLLLSLLAILILAGCGKDSPISLCDTSIPEGAIEKGSISFKSEAQDISASGDLSIGDKTAEGIPVSDGDLKIILSGSGTGGGTNLLNKTGGATLVLQEDDGCVTEVASGGSDLFLGDHALKVFFLP